MFLEETSKNDSDIMLAELENLQSQIEDNYKELLQLKQDQIIQNSSSVIKILANSSNDLL